MAVILLLVSLSIIITKFFDCYTTSRYMSSIDMERNRLARRWMKKYGKEKVIWGGFFLAIIITGIACIGVVWITPQWYYKVLYIVLGLIVSVAQFLVALANYQQKHNWFTKILLRWKPYK